MYKCSLCEYNSKNYYGLCPRCKEGVGEEVKEDLIKKININIPSYEIKQVDIKNIKHNKPVKETIFPILNKILSTNGGFVKEQVVVIGASPGTGKSTLCTQIADEDTIYIGTEESYDQINSRFARVNPNSKSKIVSDTNLEVILDIINKSKEKLIIIDSLNSINNGVDSYLRQSQNMARITNTLKENNKIGIIIAQVTKSGNITGFNTILHIVDTVLYLERNELNSNIILYSNKNRFCEIGAIDVFKHTPEGLVEIRDLEGIKEKSPGISYSKANFGFRTVNIRIEALVAPSSLNYGLRKVNGVNLSRVQQILGVISYFDSSINFMNKDIYVSISNGLSINDANLDLPIANSIISSYFKKNTLFMDNIQGIISLNGQIRNPDIKHIKELINMYKF